MQGNPNGVDLQRASATDIKGMVANAEGCILICIADDTATLVLTTHRAGHPRAGVDFAASATKVRFIIEALKRTILSTEKGPATCLAAGITIATSFFRAIRTKENGLRAAQRRCILLASVCDACIPGGAGFRPAGVDRAHHAGVLTWLRRGGADRRRSPGRQAKRNAKELSSNVGTVHAESLPR